MTSQVKYRVLEPDEYTVPDEHDAVGDNTYLAPSADGLDALETQNVIDVLEWDYTPAETHLDGPPEPVVREDGTVAIVAPTDSGDDVEAVDLGTWECLRCGARTSTPVINGSIQEPHECEGCDRQGPFQHCGLPEHTDLSPSTFADPQWAAPSGITDEHYGELWSDVRDWIHTNWVADDEHLYDGLTAFAISTWLRPNFNFLPQLMVMGKHETGKTRLLTTLARISYRGRVPVSFTPAAIFRTIDKYDITLFLSEYHDLNQDLKDEVNAVIKGSQKRGEDVMRTEKGPEGGYEPANFDIFTHVAIGTQFDPPDDIVSRCIQIQTKPADRDVPVWFDEEQATALRDRLLYTRYRLLNSEEWAHAEQTALEWLNDRGVTGRLREKLLSLVTVADLWGERDAIEAFVEAMEAEAEEASAESDDAIFIQAVRDLAFEEIEATPTIGDTNPWAGIAIPVSDVRDRFNGMTGRDVQSTYIGQIRGRLGLEKTRHSAGTVIKDENLAPKLEALCEENNLEWEHSDTGADDSDLPGGGIEELDEPSNGVCALCGNAGRRTHKEDGDPICRSCAEEALKYE